MEFDSLAGELTFFEWFDLDVSAVEVEVPLHAGDLVIFDNLALAHGRRGSRRPAELHQRVYGHRALAPAAQRALRDRFLAVFEQSRPAPLRSAVSTQ
jgi:alpha-ketoglutarate-dependent taurine dioxygenase